jgi:hypothetical protein
MCFYIHAIDIASYTCCFVSRYCHNRSRLLGTFFNVHHKDKYDSSRVTYLFNQYYQTSQDITQNHDPPIAKLQIPRAIIKINYYKTLISTHNLHPPYNFPIPPSSPILNTYLTPLAFPSFKFLNPVSTPPNPPPTTSCGCGLKNPSATPRAKYLK